MPETSRTDRDRIFTSRAPDAASGALAANSIGELDRGAFVRRDLVRWGPIFGGLVTVVALLAILSSLGLAIGLSALEPGDRIGEVSTGAWIWGVGSAALAFFVGGAVAAMSAAVGGRDRGLLNGLLVGAASIAASLLLIGFGAGALLGAGASALGDVIDSANQLNFNQQGGAGTSAFARAESNAWGSFVGLSLAVVLAGLGGLAGARSRAGDESTRG